MNWYHICDFNFNVEEDVNRSSGGHVADVTICIEEDGSTSVDFSAAGEENSLPSTQTAGDKFEEIGHGLTVAEDVKVFEDLPMVADVITIDLEDDSIGEETTGAPEPEPEKVTDEIDSDMKNSEDQDHPLRSEDHAALGTKEPSASENGEGTPGKEDPHSSAAPHGKNDLRPPPICLDEQQRQELDLIVISSHASAFQRDISFVSELDDTEPKHPTGVDTIATGDAKTEKDSSTAALEPISTDSSAKAKTSEKAKRFVSKWFCIKRRVSRVSLLRDRVGWDSYVLVLLGRRCLAGETSPHGPIRW